MSRTDPVDPLAVALAQLDQALAGMGHLTKLVSAYYQHLRDDGVPDHAATQLTCGYQQWVLAAAAEQQSDQGGAS